MIGLRAWRESAVILLLPLVIAVLSLPVAANTFTAFGPKTYRRARGAPVTVSTTFTVLNPSTQFTISASGTTAPGSGDNEDEAAALITINGQTVISPSDFENGRTVTKSVTLLKSNTISVEILGSAGSTMIVQITGIDTDPPVIVAKANPRANKSGWNDANVTVSFTCTDATSGIASCPAAVTVNTEGAAQVISGTAVDKAGLTATTSLTLNIDKTGPSVTPVLTPPADAAAWNNTSVNVSFTCSDSLSGVATCPAAKNLTLEGARQIVTGTSTDIAGNSTTASVTVNIDKTPPTITATPSVSPNAAGWITTPVTVNFACADSLSGIAICPAPQPVTSDGKGEVISGTAVDQAGNTASSAVTLNVDRTPPVITVTVSPAPNAAGWNNTGVTVTFHCSDAVSGVATCPAPVSVLSDGANQIISGTATDVAGNSASTSVTLNIAKSPPLITALLSPAANSAGWNNAPVTVSFQCTAAGAPIASCPQPQTVSTDGANQTVSGTVTDVAGNSANATATVNLDRTAPGISGSVSPSPNSNGWINSNATVTFNCSDALSGVATCSQPQSVTTEGPNQVITGTATDVAGNTATTTVTLNIEKTPPLIQAIVSPTPNSQGWNNTPVTVTFQCNGGISGGLQCPSAQTVSGEGAAQMVSGTATDNAGNSATATATISIDKTPPVITITTPSNGAVLSSSQLTVSGTVSDSLSGISTVNCAGSPATLSVGAFSCTLTLVQGSNSIPVQATDVAGNSATSTLTVSFVNGPKVVITSPAALALFNANPITVTGTIDDPTATVTANGVAGTVTGNTFTIPGVNLREAKNLLTVIGANSGGGVGTDTVTVFLDTTPPSVHIDSPSDGAILSTPQLMVTGMVNDLFNGTVAGAQVTVTVNGQTASVANHSFQVNSLLLVPGDNTLTAVATDAAGNTSQHQIHIKLQALASQQKILIISGNNQTGVIGTVLPQPLSVQLVDAFGGPIVGRPVSFTVARSDGTLLASPQQGQLITLQTDSNGQASVQLQLGSRTGAGNNQVAVTSPGFVGQVAFGESSTVGPPAAIHVVAGDHQKGIVGVPLPEPLEAIVLDAGGNPVPGVPVTFTVTQGGGLLEGAASVVKTSDADGKVDAILTLSMQEGINNNVVQASFDTMSGTAATFAASGVMSGPAAATTVSGVVMDNANQPIPGATARIKDTNLSALTNAAGQFTIQNAPVGNIVLYVDGSTSSRPQSFPFLAFQMVTVAGQENTLEMPIYLPPLDTDNSQVVGGDQDVVLTMKGVAGVAYTVFAHSATFPDGSTVGRVTLSQVHADKVPMPPPNGSAPRLVGTLQPAGIKFNPPIRMQLPNTDGLAPGTVVDLFSFHHDVEQFVSEGTGRVSADGSVVVSDPGFGLTVSGWHGSQTQPPPPTCASNCTDPSPCVTATCVNGSCQKTRNIPPGQNCHQVDIDAQIKDHDDPNADYAPSGATVVYGGSIDKTSDFLKVKAKTDPSVQVTSYTWSVSGDASGPYSPTTTEEWELGQIQTVTGQLNIHLDVAFSDGENGSADKQFQVGIRTDDIAVVVWINPAGVPLPTGGVRSDVLTFFPTNGSAGMNLVQKPLTLGYLGVLAIGLPITPTVYLEALGASIPIILNPGTSVLGEAAILGIELLLQKLFGASILLGPADMTYILDWQFTFAANYCNLNRCPVDSFSDYSSLDNYTSGTYRDQYKLFNRMQIKYQKDGSNFKGGQPDQVLRRAVQIGVTHDPIFDIGLPGEGGPNNDAYRVRNSNESHHVNEGSPDFLAVLDFNTLAAPLKWNDIGSRIVESVALGTGKQIVVQVYPTYNIYTNLTQQDSPIPQAPAPIGNFNTNPYYISTPNGPAPFLIPQ